MTVEIINLVYNLSHGQFDHMWSVVWELTLRVLRRFGLLGDVDLEFRLKMMRKHLLHVQLTSKQRFTLLFRMWPLMEYLVSVGLFCKPSRLHIRNFNIQTIKKNQRWNEDDFHKRRNVSTCFDNQKRSISQQIQGTNNFWYDIFLVYIKLTGSRTCRNCQMMCSMIYVISNLPETSFLGPRYVFLLSLTFHNSVCTLFLLNSK